MMRYVADGKKHILHSLGEISLNACNSTLQHRTLLAPSVAVRICGRLTKSFEVR